MPLVDGVSGNGGGLGGSWRVNPVPCRLFLRRLRTRHFDPAGEAVEGV